MLNVAKIDVFRVLVMVPILEVHIEGHLLAVGRKGRVKIKDAARELIVPAVKPVAVKLAEALEKGGNTMLLRLFISFHCGRKELLHPDVKGKGQLLERIKVDGNLAFFVFGEGGLALINEAGELFLIEAAALSEIMDPFTYFFCEF